MCYDLSTACRARLFGSGRQSPIQFRKVAHVSVPTQLMTDVWFRCPARWLAHRMRDAGTRVWRYEFGFGAPGSGKPPEHTSEMDYAYHAPHGIAAAHGARAGVCDLLFEGLAYPPSSVIPN